MIQLMKKKGRPCKGRGAQEKSFLLRFTREDYSKLEAVLINRDVSRAEFFRKAVLNAYENDFIH